MRVVQYLEHPFPPWGITTIEISAGVVGGGHTLCQQVWWGEDIVSAGGGEGGHDISRWRGGGHDVSRWRGGRT